jgi:hypothetical protein
MKKDKILTELKRVEHDLVFWQGKAKQIQHWIDNPDDSDRNPTGLFYPSWLANVQQRIKDAQAERERLLERWRG